MRRTLVATLVVVLTASACHSTSRPAAAKSPAVTASVTTAASTTTTSGAQTSGPRTVLSPIGLNIRAQPAKTAPILGTVARATILTVLAHSDQAGGWFQVKGSTVTGWISDNPTLTSAGAFSSFSSSTHQFSALYPAAWTYTESPPASVVFRAASPGETVVVTTAPSVTALAHGRAGYQQTKVEQIVVCGVTGDLLSYTRVSTPSTAAPVPGGAANEPLLAQVHLSLDPQNALGVEANLSDASQLQSVRDFLSSMTFPFPRCQR